MILDCGCPGEYPAWNDEDVSLDGVRAHVMPIPMFVHMPLAYEAYLRRQQEQISRLELPEKWPGFVMTRTGWLRGQIIRLLENVQSPSRFVTFLPKPFRVHAKLHPGDIGTITKTVRSVQTTLLDQGRKPKELYLCYLTCPRCEEQRGGPKILLLRRWEPTNRGN